MHCHGVCCPVLPCVAATVGTACVYVLCCQASAAEPGLRCVADSTCCALLHGFLCRHFHRYAAMLTACCGAARSVCSFTVTTTCFWVLEGRGLWARTFLRLNLGDLRHRSKQHSLWFEKGQTSSRALYCCQAAVTRSGRSQPCVSRVATGNRLNE